MENGTRGMYTMQNINGLHLDYHNSPPAYPVVAATVGGRIRLSAPPESTHSDLSLSRRAPRVPEAALDSEENVHRSKESFVFPPSTPQPGGFKGCPCRCPPSFVLRLRYGFAIDTLGFLRSFSANRVLSPRRCFQFEDPLLVSEE